MMNSHGSTTYVPGELSVTLGTTDAPCPMAIIQGTTERVSPAEGAPVLASRIVSSTVVGPREGGCGIVRTSIWSWPESEAKVARGVAGKAGAPLLEDVTGSPDEPHAAAVARRAIARRGADRGQR
jgi:hypothetical protein